MSNSKFTNRYLEYLHGKSINNKNLLSLRTSCGCFYCIKVFRSNSINAFVDNGSTALCPHCKLDSILPGCFMEDDLNIDILEAMNKKYF